MQELAQQFNINMETVQELIAGHKYLLTPFESGGDVQVVHFIHKEPISNGSTELKTVHNGITNESVLEMMIKRMNYLQSKFPCRENSIVITKLEESLMWLNKRTADRVKRNVEGKQIA